MKLKYAFALFVIFFAAFAGPSPDLFSAVTNGEVLSQQIENAKKERESLLAEQKKLQAELEAINLETRNLGSAVKSLDTTRKKLAADIKVTESKLKSTSLNIQTLENTMVDKERDIETHEAAISFALQSLADADTRPLLLDVLAASSLSDIWRDKTQLQGLNERLQQELYNIRETKNILALEKKKKELAKEEILDLQAELSGQKSVVEENQKAKERLLAETKSKEAVYQQMLAENLARQKESEADIFKLESELKIKLDPSLIPSSRPGLLTWPLDTVFITQRFGHTHGSARLYASGTHNGVDFRASQGTPVRAMLSGTVEGTGNTDEMNAQLRRQRKPVCGSYGRWILIRHDNGLSSAYAHLSASIVSPGQIVKTGEIIGYSGGTPGVNGSGYSTGPHLHVGLFASQGVKIGQFTTSNHCKHTVVPLVDVKAYLDPLAYLPALY